jgi:hypothetical protein
MKISFLYSKIVVLKNVVRKFLFISSFRWYGDFFDDCNIFLNRLSELLLIVKISKIRTKSNTILWKRIFLKFSQNIAKDDSCKIVFDFVLIFDILIIRSNSLKQFISPETFYGNYWLKISNCRKMFREKIWILHFQCFSYCSKMYFIK